MKSKVSQEFCDWSEPIEVTQNEINEFADVTSTSQTRESFQRTGPARLPDA